MVGVAGEIVPPGYCGAEGRSPRGWSQRRLPGPGGIVLTQRVGDRCVGLAADGLEPGVAVQSLHRDPGGNPDGPNRALNAYACIGNRALVLTGPARGQRGVVTGKYGDCDHVCVDFPFKVLRRLRIGDRLQIYSYGLGLRLSDHPELGLRNCSPRLLRRWGLASAPRRLLVPVTHRIPVRSLAKEALSSHGGDEFRVPPEYAIQLSDSTFGHGLGLDRLRFGDLVAIQHGSGGYAGRGGGGVTTIVVVVSGDRPATGQGPGLLSLIAGASRYLEPVQDSGANLATVLGLRALPRAAPVRYPGSLALNELDE